MEITWVFGLSLRLKHSCQTQLHNYSRRSHALLLFAFHCLTRISLGGWIPLYSFVFHTFALKVTQNIPARRNKCREVDYQNANTVNSTQNSKHMFVSSWSRVHVNKKKPEGEAHKSFDLNIHVTLKKTSETSKSFENNTQSSAMAIRFWNIAQFFITVVAVTCSATQKFSHILLKPERLTQTLKNALYFVVEFKPLFLGSF